MVQKKNTMESFQEPCFLKETAVMPQLIEFRCLIVKHNSTIILN